MKRHLLAGLIAFCVGAMALTTVSCGKLEEDIKTLQGQVEDLNIRLTALEARLTNEVNTLNATIAAAKTAAETDNAALKAELEAKIAVVGIATKDGNVVLTLADGSTITVAVPDANANNTGLITTVTEGGKTYWAVIGNDGKATSLGVEVGHPDVKLAFKVNTETKELLISYDGTNYEGTGVLVKNPDEYDHIVTAFEEGEDYVTFTIGEKTYKLPKYDSLAVIELSRTEMFVNYGQSKTVTVEAENVTDLYIMNQPAGWFAELEDDVITITAPTEIAHNLGFAATDGNVLVHATDASGKCSVATIEVVTGPATSLSIDEEGNVTVFSSLVKGYSNWGETYYDFTPIKIGIVPADEFLTYEDFQEFLESAAYSEENNGYFAAIAGNYFDYDEFMSWYEEGVNEELFGTLPLDAIANGFWPSMELNDTTTYVVWTVPFSDAPDYDEAHFVFTEPYIEIETSNAVYNDMDIDLSLYGADEYYVGIVNKTEMKMMGIDLEMYLTYGPNYQGGPWNDFLNGNVNSMGEKFEDGEYSIQLSDLAGTAEIEAGCEYYIYVLPYTIGKPHSEYVFAESITPYLAIGKTADYIYNESLKAEITDIKALPFEYSCLLTPPADGKTYYYTFSKEQYDEMTAEDIEMYLGYSYPISEAEEINENYGIEPGSTHYVVTYSVKNGEEGPVCVTEITAPELPKSDAIKVSFVSLTTDTENNKYIATYTVEGAAYFAGYNISYPGSSWSPSLPAFEKNVYKQSSTGFTKVEVPADGKITVEFDINSRKTHYLASAFNLADDAVSAMAATTLVLDLATGELVDITE